MRVCYACSFMLSFLLGSISKGVGYDVQPRSRSFWILYYEILAGAHAETLACLRPQPAIERLQSEISNHQLRVSRYWPPPTGLTTLFDGTFSDPDLAIP
jgi:hypothetical protein